MVDLVAQHGLHGTSMSMIAEQAGVATGTAYVHYDSKEALLVAAFVEVKTGLGRAALHEVDLSAEPRTVFEEVWRNCHRYLSDDPSIAGFLVQVEVSPLRKVAHDALPGDDPLTSAAEGLGAYLVDLPAEVLYDLSLAPAVRLVASGTALSKTDLSTVIESCWRAVAKT
ncbi:MAG: TetR/AcrR family transcriptional regulator [Armatimonadetes bacterium]|nr:MAG: TetR/AcrR family transcriptional regulator [Armatimonadota bacterium]